jgi:replicative superfamily II helicase
MTKRILDWIFPIKMLLLAAFDDLYPFQKKAICAFEQGKDVLVKAPTATGKTTIPLICSNFILKQKKRCVFLVPTKRLIDQTYDKLMRWFKRKYRIVKVTGAHRPSHRQIKKAHIIVATYESYNGLLAKNYEYALLKKVGLVVVDEMHYVGYHKRGPRLETAIVNTKEWLRPRPQMLYLTASSLKNAKDIAKWRKAVFIKTDKRYSKLVVETPIIVDNEEERIANCFQLIKETYEVEIGVEETDKRGVLVFCKWTWLAEERAEILASMFEQQGYNITVSYSHAKLNDAERRRRMKAFQVGDINVLCTTTEYREGVDAPVLRVVIADAETFTSQDIEQMIGRAARPQFFHTGYANLIVEGDAQVILKDKGIRIDKNEAKFKEISLKSRAESHFREIIINRAARGAVSIKQLHNYLKRFFFWYQHKTPAINWYTLMRIAIMKQEVDTFTIDNKSIVSLMKKYPKATPPLNFQELGFEFVRYVDNEVKTLKKRNTKTKTPKSQLEKLEFEKKVLLDLLKRFSEHKLKEIELQKQKQLDSYIKFNLKNLIAEGFLERKEDYKFRATAVGKWASQFLLPISVAFTIHNLFQSTQFSTEDQAYEKLITVLAECVHGLINTNEIQCKEFIKAIVLGFDVEEASARARMKEGAAEKCRETASWIGEAVYAYVNMKNPMIVDIAKDINTSLTVMEQGEIGPKVRYYPEEKPLCYEGIQDVMHSIIKRRGYVSYDALYEEVIQIYDDDSIDRTTIIRNAKELQAQGKIAIFPRGQGEGRPHNYVCIRIEDVPEYMFKTCGMCVFRMSCNNGEKERPHQRFTCELRREYNKRMENRTMSTRVTLNMGACQYVVSSRTRKFRSFKQFKKMNSDKSPLCQVCEVEPVKIPESYMQYTSCSNCSSDFYYRCDGGFNVKPGARDLLQQKIVSILGKTVKPVKTLAKTDGLLNRQYVHLNVGKGDRVYINQRLLIYVPKEGKTCRYRLDAIEEVRVHTGAKVDKIVYDTLDDRIYSAKNVYKVNRTPFKEFEGVFDFILSDKLKLAAQIIRGTEEGMRLAWKIVISKKISNAFLTLRAGEEGLLDPLIAEEFYDKQMNVVAHIFRYWTGGLKNLLSYEADGERVMWDAIRLIVEDEPLDCGSRTQGRYIFSVPFMGEAKARNPFHAGLNAVYRRVLNNCRNTLFDVGFSRYPDELILHYRSRKGQRISLGTVVDFREMFLPLFRYEYVKVCKKGEITEDDFELDYTSRDEEVYTLTNEGKEKVRRLAERVMNEQVYYLDTKMPLHKAMKESANYLCLFLLNKLPEVKDTAGQFQYLLEKPFIPFVCVSDKKTFNKIFTFFQQVETFCKLSDKDPPFSMLDMLK